MPVIVSNTSPLIPSQFPVDFQVNGPNFVFFAQEYFRWMEQEPQSSFYARNLYNIHDIDNTFEQFLVHFKNKYLNNIQFSTVADFRLLIKHALDIYRSKGTERCTLLIFQFAFGVRPGFYYPSTDLFRVSDGTWYLPRYLELQLQGSSGNPNNIALQQKEIRGTTSGALAFVDNIVRRFDNNKLADVAYISAIVGQFVPGETVIPTDGSLAVANCPAILGSMTQIQLPAYGTGVQYNVGDVIPISSNNGVGGILRVANTEEVSGIVAIEFDDGGYGYSFSPIYANISFSSASGPIANAINLWGYSPNVELYVVSCTDEAGSGELNCLVLSGNAGVLPTTLWTAGNTYSLTVDSTVVSNVAPVVYISTEQLSLGNLVMATSAHGYPNVEQSQYFNFMDVITQPQVEVAYGAANGVFLESNLVSTFYPNGSVAGTGVILNAVQTSANVGTLLINIYSGDESSFEFELYNDTGGKCVPTAVSDMTSYCNFIANLDQITVAVSNVTGNGFYVTERLFQGDPIPGVQLGQKQQGWGVVSAITLPANSTEPYVISITNVVGRFVGGPVAGLIGEVSQATATVVSANIVVGVINTTGNFFPAPYAYVTSPIMSGTLLEKIPSGQGFNLTIPAALSYPENINVNIDSGAQFAGVWANASSYGFPGDPTVNANNANVSDALNYMALTVGKLANAYLTGVGINYSAPPFLVVDNRFVSRETIENNVVQLANAAANFFVGETVYQGNSTVWIARGEVLPTTNANYLWLQRMSYSNNFVVTANAASGLLGATSGTTATVVSVDYDVFSGQSPMGRNSVVVPLFQSGNGAIANAGVVASGYGFVNGETIGIGSNGATGQVILGGVGLGSGYYTQNGGFLSDVKKLFDGYFYQNFSYQIISDLMVDSYYNMMMELCHVAGTIMFGEYLHTSTSGGGLNIQNVLLGVANSVTGNTYSLELLATVTAAEAFVAKKLKASKTIVHDIAASHKGKVG